MHVMQPYNTVSAVSTESEVVLNIRNDSIQYGQSRTYSTAMDKLCLDSLPEISNDSYRHIVLKFSQEFHCNIGYNKSTARMHNDKLLLPESDSEFGFVSLAASVTSGSPANSSSMKDSLKYLRRSFCRESCRNTSDTAADRLWTKMTTCR